MKSTVLNKSKLSVKSQVIATLAAIVTAVALPQILHLAGQHLSLGTALGETYLPMHLPIMLVGLLAGPVAGAVSGVLAPIVSSLLTGMPVAMALPFILIEVFTYGFVAGLLSERKFNIFGKVAVTQLAGRIMRVLAVFIATSAFGFEGMTVLGVLKSMSLGLIGIAIQWVILPVVIKVVDKKNEN